MNAPIDNQSSNQSIKQCAFLRYAMLKQDCKSKIVRQSNDLSFEAEVLLSRARSISNQPDVELQGNNIPFEIIRACMENIEA